MSNIEQTFSLKSLECEQVVVFQDRAEVKRLLRANIKKGENEIILTNVTSSIDKDSVRVEGKGNASIVDVICESKSVLIDQNETNEKLRKAKFEIKQIEDQIEEAKLKLERISKKSQVVNEFANTLSKSTNTQKPELTLSRENVDSFLSFIDLYSSKIESFDKEKIFIQNELTNLEEKLNVSKQNYDQLSFGNNFEQKIEITIVIETTQENCDIQLNISYLVYNASWTPKYDIRANGKEKSMIIKYFGMIKQTTGEDWIDTKLSLSTAVPSIGGNVPKLVTQNVCIKPKYKFPQSANIQFKSKKLDSVVKASLPLKEFGLGESEKSESCSINEMETIACASSSVGSTVNFNIPRKSNIPSDNKTHNVSIANINLSAEFEYETVPKINTHAYIKAKVKNTSEFALLAGRANVFLDNNFVSKTNLSAYSPQEELNISLGVDPSIRIDYKPIKKYTIQQGFVSKTISTTYIQIIEIKNTGQNKVKIKLIDNLPLSSDDKIQVKLVEPSLKNNSNIKLNKENNLEFNLEILSGKCEEITVKYIIENPHDKQIEFY